MKKEPLYKLVWTHTGIYADTSIHSLEFRSANCGIGFLVHVENHKGSWVVYNNVNKQISPKFEFLENAKVFVNNYVKKCLLDMLV